MNRDQIINGKLAMMSNLEGYEFTPIDEWIVSVTGFGQREGHLTGLEILHTLIRKKCSGVESIALLKSWNDNTNDVAERIWRMRRIGGTPRVVLIGFSYGGYTAVLIAKELQKRGIKVSHLFLVDAVWRYSRYFPSFVSLLPFWRIHIPTNVKKVINWRQYVSKPKGHKIVVDPDHTEHEEHTLDVIHSYCDDHPDVYQRVLEFVC